MGPDPDKNHDELLAEREAILRQLELLGSESDSDDDDEEKNDESLKNKIEPGNIREEDNAGNIKDESLLMDIHNVAKEEIVEEDYTGLGLIQDESKYDNNNPCSSIQNNEENSLDDIEFADRKTQDFLDEDEEASVRQDQNSSGSSDRNSRSSPIFIEKLVMDRIDVDKSCKLPEGWTLITHHSGMPVYYHRFTRVVTHSRPYQVEGMIRDHKIPISTIPCLFREVMDKKHEELEKRNAKCPMSYEEKRTFLEIPFKDKLLMPDQYREYCERRFKFRKMTVTRFTNPADKDNAVQQKRVNSLLKKKGFEMDYDQLKKRNDPGDMLLSSASGAVLIDMTPIKMNNPNIGTKKPYLLNPMGKTSVAVLNEFVQRLAKGNLVYEIEDTRNVSNPYKATAMLTMKMSIINEMAGQCKESLIVLSEIASASNDNPNMSTGVPPDSKRFEIGSGVGANKKTARLVAAKDAMLKLIPKLKMNEEYVCDGVIDEDLQKGFEEESRELFRRVKIDSPNLVQMCTRFAIPKPYSLLRDAVSRSLRWNGMELTMRKEMVGNGSQMSKVILGLGHMEEEAEAVGVKQATQLAAQRLFMRMHPELQTYGNFLDVYGKLNDKSKLDTAKRQHDQVVRLHDTGNLLEPNTVVLSKLSEEMKRVSLVYPPKKYLFGLAPHATGCRITTRSVLTQTNIDPRPMPIMNVHPSVVNPPYFHGPIPPMNPQMNQIPPYMHHPYPQEYTDYQSPQYHQNNPRKRGRPEDADPKMAFSQFPRHHR